MHDLYARMDTSTQGLSLSLSVQPLGSDCKGSCAEEHVLALFWRLMCWPLMAAVLFEHF